MKSTSRLSIPVTLVALFLLVSGCDSLPVDVMTSGNNGGIEASGVVEAVEVAVSSDLSGRVVEVFVGESDQVQAGDPLFKIEDELLEGQRQQSLAAHQSAQAHLDAANAALDLAESSLKAAQAGVETAKIQYDLELYAARMEEQQDRATLWDQDVPDEFSLPGWYYNKSEEIQAAEAEVEAALQAMENERRNYEIVVQDASNADFTAVEQRLANAQSSYLVAETLTNREISTQSGGEQVEDHIQTFLDSAEAELEAAQLEYDQMLSDQSAEEVLEARARLSVARERYEVALDNLNALLTGEQSLTVRAAEAGLRQAEAGEEQAAANIAQAEAGVVQAEKALAQSQAALDLVNLQIEKLTVRAPIDGVVMTRNVQPGEVIQPGMTAMTIAQTDELTVTVYIPEDTYGRINLGERATLSVDSFPDETFTATVTRIADHAEYTPRNVQTKEDRQTTVYAVELQVEDPEGKLKPGMPTDVEFNN